MMWLRLSLIHILPKNDYNDKVTELKTANKTIADLKKDNADNAELQQKVSNYETEISKLKKNAEDTAKTYALKESLSKAGVLDPDYLISVSYTHLRGDVPWKVQNSGSIAILVDHTIGLRLTGLISVKKRNCYICTLQWMIILVFLKK